MQEEDDRKLRAEKKLKKERIMEIIAQKQDSKLEGKSEKALLKEIEEL